MNSTAGASQNPLPEEVVRSATVSSFDLSMNGQIAVTVHDVPRAMVFYRDVLNMRLLFEIPPKTAFFNCGGVRLMLSPPESAEYDHPDRSSITQWGPPGGCA